MSASIEQRIGDLLRHSDVWEETKESLREMLSDHQAGKLDPDDERYIEGLHAKVFGGRSGASESRGKPAQNRVRDTPPQSLPMTTRRCWAQSWPHCLRPH